MLPFFFSFSFTIGIYLDIFKLIVIFVVWCNNQSNKQTEIFDCHKTKNGFILASATCSHLYYGFFHLFFLYFCTLKCMKCTNIDRFLLNKLENVNLFLNHKENDCHEIWDFQRISIMNWQWQLQLCICYYLCGRCLFVWHLNAFQHLNFNALNVDKYNLKQQNLRLVIQITAGTICGWLFELAVEPLYSDWNLRLWLCFVRFW